MKIFSHFLKCNYLYFLRGFVVIIFKSSLPKGSDIFIWHLWKLACLVFPMIDLYTIRSIPPTFLSSKLHVTCILILGLVLLITKRNISKIKDHQYNMFYSFQCTHFIDIHCSPCSTPNISRILPNKQNRFYLSVLVSTLQVTSLYFSASKLGIKLFSLKLADGRSFPKANLEHSDQVELLPVKPWATAVIVLGSDHP